MGVRRNLNFGWYVEFPDYTRIWEVAEQLTKHGLHYAEDFVIGIDPMTGTQNHIGVPNYDNLSLRIDDGDDTMVLRWDQIERMRMVRPEPLIQYVNDVNSIYGDDFAAVKFGLIQWFN